VSFESPAHILTWAGTRQHEFVITRLFDGDPLPSLPALDALVVMGGPMSVHDEAHFPWLRDEKHIIATAIESGVRVLGVCLGAQLIAQVSGARVYRNRFQEIGWFPVEASGEGMERFALPHRFDAFHWHGDTFHLPAGAVHLARTDGCEQQMFAMGERVLGIQFHLEVTPSEIKGMVAHAGIDLPEGPYVQPPEQLEQSSAACAKSHALLDDVLDRWIGKEQT
jgi:GMP synthase-like glutamine amidotransferase